jgi:hypothetical protein
MYIWNICSRVKPFYEMQIISLMKDKGKEKKQRYKNNAVEKHTLSLTH